MTNSWPWAHVSDPLKQHLPLLNRYDSILVGYSGGLDSTVLLHLLASIPDLKDKITVVHVNHQLHPNANSWEKHCKTITEEFKLPFYSDRVTITQKPQQSLEEEARHARYSVFEKYLPLKSCLTLGHHQLDQAETVLLQLMRGSGLHGLSGMPLIRHKKNYDIIRPLLSVEKQSLVDYAKSHHLNWIEDSSNLDTNFRRNFIRHQILPLLNERFPNAEQQIARSADVQQQTLFALEDLLAPHYKKCLCDMGKLCVRPLLSLSLALQQELLRTWLRSMHIRLPNRRRLNTFLRQLAESSPDKSPKLAWQDNVVIPFQDKLYLLTQHQDNTNPHKSPIKWKTPFEPLTLPNQLGMLKLKKETPNARLCIPPNASVSIRFRGGGERILLNNYHQKLKNLFQMWSIPPWLRDKIPLIFIDNEIAAIPGYCISDHFNKLHPESYHLIHVS